MSILIKQTYQIKVKAWFQANRRWMKDNKNGNGLEVFANMGIRIVKGTI